MIEIRGLTARLGQFELRDVSFEIPDRGYGVVIGPAGSGKTTMLEAIAGVVPALKGEIRLNGHPVTSQAPDERGVGLVYQHGYLFPHLSVVENLRYGARDEATVDELVRRLDIGPLRERDVRALSGGERQLVSLARTLARRPAVILLDEPFSAVDPIAVEDLQREVKRLKEEFGKSVLITDHNVAQTLRVCDRALIIGEGRVKFEGAPREIINDPGVRSEYLGNTFRGDEFG